MVDISASIPVIDGGITLIVGGAVSWLAARAIALVPALGSVLTATRVTQVEEALSNIVVGKANDILSGKTTAKAEALEALNTISEAGKTAMSAQGTTDDMMALRVAGNALTKIGSLSLTPSAPPSISGGSK